MSFPSSAFKNTHPSPPPKENTTSNLVLSRASCQDQGQTLDSELGLMEMLNDENVHLMQIFSQGQMESQMGPQDGPDTQPPLTTMMDNDTTGVSTNLLFQVLDLSTSSNDHNLVMQGEKTPLMHGEVPDCVLARVKEDESPVAPSATGRRFLLNSSKPKARVCLEKRFSSVSADTARQQDVHSDLRNHVTVFQESAEAQEAVAHSQKLVFHTVEPFLDLEFIFPESVSNSFHPESLVTKTVFADRSNSREHELVNPKKNLAAHYINLCSLISQPKTKAKAAPDMERKSQKGDEKRGKPGMTVSQRRDRHNSNERERRKKIRLCCDELNKMVPFCDSYTDKVSTLLWTVSFLTYIKTIHGDAFNADFMKFIIQKGEEFKSNSSWGAPLFPEPEEKANVPEQ
ncbi:uncharacterized protein [Nothobranchius furzeri]|uniref:Transcript variant X1 n=1 Tax=Nothobranchius furzeri TaxID=105023 RepID=A0A1A8AR64_NOTFU|nr:uncharacterized protein LOC107391194 [Nothobranchius furzeri]XP_015823827.1 uncharacterized protein LOC107391194 [Nothobranchius furzeri]KAF7210198.1 transcript variant X1 [Nothobranchius furzeri]KAF7210199.1 transcript variant X2 [Nothobranchius furzeri]